MTSDANAWRGVIAALANPESRHVLGLLIAEQDAATHLAALSPARRSRVLRSLVAVGLIDPVTADDPEPRLCAGRFAELLAASPIERRTGIDRFITNGRLDHYPAGADDRAEVLRFIASKAMPDGRLLDEKTVTERLAALTDDPVTMRRYLVDAGLLTRAPDGSRYWRALNS